MRSALHQPTTRRNATVAVIACAFAALGLAPAAASPGTQDVGHSCGIGVGYDIPPFLNRTCQFYCLWPEDVFVYVLGPPGAWGEATCHDVYATCQILLTDGVSCTDQEGPVARADAGTCVAGPTAVQVQCWAR